MMQLTQNRVAKSTILALGVLLAALMAAMISTARPVHAATTFTVNSTGDAGDVFLANDVCDASPLPGRQCTLRAAIQEANDTPGADAVHFSIAGGGVKTIKPDSQLPEITEQVNINGYTQGDATADPGDDARPNTLAVGTNAVLKIELSGARVGFGEGLRISAANNTVKGLVINRWDYGIVISGSGATNNKVTGNYIGTDASGTQDLGNTFNGVFASGPNNTVGGTQAGARNVISANDLDGVDISGPNATGNEVMGNYIGTDASGTQDLGNTFGGVLISGPDNTVGGTQAGARNVISGNDYDGVDIFGGGATGNKIEGNYVGTDASHAEDLGNGDYGVRMVGANNNTIGGMEAGARNIISGNDRDGVHIFGDGTTGNSVLSNSIFSNARLGIDLGGDGPTANDLKDPDTGPNNLQNKPVLTSAQISAGSTTVQGKLNSTPNKTFVVQFYSSPAGTGDQGKTFEGQKNVTTDANGNASFSFSSTEIEAARIVTATATDAGGNTSEFSAPKTVVAT